MFRFLILVAEQKPLIHQADRLLYHLPESPDGYDDTHSHHGGTEVTEEEQNRNSTVYEYANPHSIGNSASNLTQGEFCSIISIGLLFGY